MFEKCKCVGRLVLLTGRDQGRQATQLTSFGAKEHSTSLCRSLVPGRNPTKAIRTVTTICFSRLPSHCKSRSKWKQDAVLRSQNAPNKACRRLGYASRIHGRLAQSAERLTQTVGRSARETEMKNDNHETASSVQPDILADILFFRFPGFTTHLADGDFTASSFGRRIRS